MVHTGAVTQDYIPLDRGVATPSKTHEFNKNSPASPADRREGATSSTQTCQAFRTNCLAKRIGVDDIKVTSNIRDNLARPS